MNGNAYYSNKGWARKAMTILINKMKLFEVVDRTAKGYETYAGVYELGVKFFSSRKGMVTVWPTCEDDLNEIDALAY
ncbi:MAG: hypothetical protein FWH27_14845 [Planctomycetaceae bacterium]|nr:hypothetical protein [Planctomycetaceae bacterium]